MRAPERTPLAALALTLALGLAAPSAMDAQAAAARPAAAAVPAEPALPEAEVYRREVFRYPAGGRPDPFQPLLGSEEMGVRVQDLRLVGIVYSGDPRASVATFTLPDSAQRVRLRVGQRLGSVTVLAIQPRRVDLREDEMGVSRVYQLPLERARPGVTGGPPAPAPAQPAPAATPAGGRP